MSPPTFAESFASIGNGGSTSTINDTPHSFPFVETFHQEIINDVTTHKKPLSLGGVHIGAAGFFNLDIIAARKSEAAILCDINHTQEEFWGCVIQQIKDSPTREDFVEKASHWLPNYGSPTSRFNGKPMVESMVQRLQDDLTRPSSWLSSAESYDHIRSLASKDRIARVTVDLTNTADIEKLSKTIKATEIDGHPIHTDTLYLSNIAYFLMDSSDYYGRAQDPKHVLQTFMSGISQLTCPETTIIEASIRKSHGGGRKPYLADAPVEFKTRAHFDPLRATRVLTALVKKTNASQVL